MSSSAQVPAPADSVEALRDLLGKIFARVPKNRKLTPEVALQLLRSKYTSMFSAPFLLSMEGEVRATLERLYAPQQEPAVPDSDGDSNSDDDSDSDDDSGEDSDGEDDSGSSGSETDDDDDSDVDEEDDGATESGSDDGEREAKRARVDSPLQQQIDGDGDEARELAVRCKEMFQCLVALQYAPRKRLSGDSLHEYLHQYLVPQFTANGLDPERHGKADVKRYRMRKELEFLQADGASLTLDRSSRRGRGFTATTATPAGSGAVPAPGKPMFLDDDDE